MTTRPLPASAPSARPDIPWARRTADRIQLRAHIVLLFLASGLGAFAAEPATRSFDLLTDAAERSLKKFSSQSGREVLFATETVNGTKTNAVRGDYTPQAAADMMLAGTGLAAVLNARTGAFTISRASGPNGERAAPNPTSARPARNDAMGDGDTIQLNAFVTTGSVTPRKQLESPVAITTIDRGRIDDLAPRNLAEFVKTIPGVYAESAAGEAFNNVSIRGIGPIGGFLYAMLHEDGLPVFSVSNLRHGLPDAFTRVTTFVDRVEALRSGTSNVFASQAPLALINLISREGGSNLEGETAVTISDYGTLRTDLWLSGPAGKNTTFALGGWYRVDDGLRPPGFVANRGGQLLGNLKHAFESGRGYVKVSFKAHDDHNIFDQAHALTGGSKFRAIPFGPDLKRDTTSPSGDQRIISVLNTPVGNVQFDLADGIYSQVNYVGTETQFKLADNITLENRNRYSDGFRAIDYMFNGVPTAWQVIANAAAGRDATQFAAGRTGSNYSFRLTYPGQNNAVAAANATAAAVLGNGLGNRKNWQHSDGPINNFQDDLRLIGSFNEEKTIVTAGAYYAFLKQEQHYLFLTLLTDVTPEPRRVDITILDAATGAAIGPATFNGIFHFADQYRNSTGEQREISPYALIEHKVGRFTLDAGVRHNRVRQVVTREFTANNFVTNNSTNPALRTGQFGTGNFESRANRASATAYTFGGNYAFSRNLAVYARYKQGVRFHDLTEFADDVVAGSPASPSRILNGYEVGVKFGTRKFGVVLTAFNEKVKDIFDSQVTIRPDGTLGPNVFALASQKSNGVELETTWTPLSGLSLGLNASWQDPKWTDHNLKTQTLSNGQTVAFDEFGLTPERTPKVYGKVLASYQFPATAWGRLAVNASYQYTGERPVDRANGPINPLTAYGETQAGAIFAFSRSFSVRLSINNLFDDDGLTQGDPRGGSNILDPTTAFYNGRPISRRSFTGTVSYRF